MGIQLRDIQSDKQLLAAMGTDPALWAEAFSHMPRHDEDAWLQQATAWFAAAINAGAERERSGDG